MKSIVTVTVNPAIDKNTQVQAVVSERKLRCDRPSREPGGGGINVSRAIHRLGGQTIAVHCAGGPPGNELMSLLEREGIEQRPVGVEGFTRENLTVYEQNSGQQYRFGMPGPKLQEKEWNNCLDAVRQLESRPAYIVASGSLPPGVPADFYKKVAGVARELGARLIVDSSGEPFRAVVQEEGVFLVKPNLTELEALAGKALDRESEQVDFAKELIGQGKVEAVVISLGSGGATLVEKGSHRNFRAPTVKIRSKVGAGDSMVAGMVLALSREASLVDAVRFGNAAGSAAVMTPGSELCRKEDVERLNADMRGDDPS